MHFISIQIIFLSFYLGLCLISSCFSATLSTEIHLSSYCFSLPPSLLNKKLFYSGLYSSLCLSKYYFITKQNLRILLIFCVYLFCITIFSSLLPLLLIETPEYLCFSILFIYFCLMSLLAKEYNCHI